MQGLGKTAQTISVLQFMRERLGIEGPFLIVAPLSTLGEPAYYPSATLVNVSFPCLLTIGLPFCIMTLGSPFAS